MPFVVKDVLHHKRNDRQKREMHEREYSKYLTNLRQQQNSSHSNQYYLTSNHYNEVERLTSRSALAKQNQYDRIQRDNYTLYDRLLKASKRTTIDDKNHSYQQNLDSFNSKRLQQRFNTYKRIENDNHLLLQRINNTRGHLVTKQECDHDWKKHIDIMKKTCDYPENIEKFVSKTNKKQSCVYSTMKWDNRHFITQPSTRLTGAPLAMLLDES